MSQRDNLDAEVGVLRHEVLALRSSLRTTTALVVVALVVFLAGAAAETKFGGNVSVSGVLNCLGLTVEGPVQVTKDLNVTGEVVSSNITEMEKSLKTLQQGVSDLQAFEDSVKKDGKVHWKAFEGNMDRDGEMGPVDFGGFGKQVLDPQVFFQGTYLSFYRNRRIDHNVDTIRVQLKIARIDGTKVFVHASNYMHDDQGFNGDHCSAGGVISFVVIARVK